LSPKIRAAVEVNRFGFHACIACNVAADFRWGPC
jgi:hypothetical protein